ncbi:MAG: hypothetical protein V3R33_09675 [Anaerolineales bacterium]
MSPNNLISLRAFFLTRFFLVLAGFLIFGVGAAATETFGKEDPFWGVFWIASGGGAFLVTADPDDFWLVFLTA